MESFVCDLSNEPTLLFDEEGFRFVLGEKTWKFHPHLWIENGDAFSVRARSDSAKDADRNTLGELDPEKTVPGKILYGLDRWLTHPERLFIFKKTVSEVIEFYFAALHLEMGNAFLKADHLRVIRPVLFSRDPPDEGLAVVRLKGALHRAGFPEKQRWVTPFQDIPQSERDLVYATSSHTQFRRADKEVGIARGWRDAGMVDVPTADLSPVREDKKTNLLLESAKRSLEVRSQLPFLKDWAYLQKLYPMESKFLSGPQAIRSAPLDNSTNFVEKFGAEALYFSAENARTSGSSRELRFGP